MYNYFIKHDTKKTDLTVYLIIYLDFINISRIFYTIPQINGSKRSNAEVQVFILKIAKDEEVELWGEG